MQARPRLHKFIQETFKWEGEFQNNPFDKGNWYRGKLYGTIYGITARDHFNKFSTILILWSNDRKSMALDKAEDFYAHSEYWNDLYEQIIDSSLAFRLWDFSVNAGPIVAIKLLQKTINKKAPNPIKVDGMFGQVTLGMVNYLSIPKDEVVETSFYYEYEKAIEHYYRSLRSFTTFGKGWIKRLKRVFNGSPNLSV